MIILSIETSCDETGIAILEAKGNTDNPSFKILGEALNSQIKLHEQYGGVFPMMAKREHARNLVPLLLKTLNQANILKQKHSHILQNMRMLNSKKSDKIRKILEKEQGLYETFEKHIFSLDKPPIDVIAVTECPGLEPTLWVGINFAKALGELWNIPVKGVNHMEGHIFSVLISGKKISNSQFLISKKIHFPALALLISGGHTELVEVKKFGKYKILGKTRDDAVGEAFDKVARILGLPYPGGPEISLLTEKARKEELRITNYELRIKLPRPMIYSKDLDFSFSGIKTAVLYLVQKLKALSPKLQAAIAKEFEDAVTEVLVYKTKVALEKTKANTLIVAGGVSANTHIKKEIKNLKKEFRDLNILFPDKKLTGDNAVMIGMPGYMKIMESGEWIVDSGKQKNIKAKGNLSL